MTPWTLEPGDSLVRTFQWVPGQTGEFKLHVVLHVYRGAPRLEATAPTRVD